jgi:hypothetical protein
MNYRKPPERGRPPIVAAQYEFGSKSLNAAFSNLSMMYSGFIGIPHFRMIAKLIGYQVLFSCFIMVINPSSKRSLGNCGHPWRFAWPCPSPDQ